MAVKKQGKKALYAAAEGMETPSQKKKEMSMAKKALAKKPMPRKGARPAKGVK